MRLLWKLVAVNVVSIGLVLGIVLLAVHFLAADYFAALMERYGISPVDSHRMFLDAIHRTLAWAAVASLSVALALSYLLTRRILAPLSQMTRETTRIAAGESGARIRIFPGDEIGELGDAFNRMARSLDELQELRRRMVIDVAHELRTPLTNVQGYLEALRDGVVPPSPEVLDTLQEESARLASLVEDVLQLARADAARSDLMPEPLDLAALLDEVLALFEGELRHRAIRVQPPAMAPGTRVVADPRRLRQVLRNLVHNAWRYTAPGGWLRVEARRLGDEVEIGIVNSGEGIAAADLPRVFERFFRGEKSRSRTHGGAGIGLAIVKELVTAHGGRVGARCGGGETCVWFTLPDPAAGGAARAEVAGRALGSADVSGLLRTHRTGSP